MAKTLSVFKKELLANKGVREAYEDQESSDPFIHFLETDPVTNAKRSQDVRDGDYWVTDNGLMLRDNGEWVLASDNDLVQSFYAIMKG